ncbi:ethylene-responsive transcription factor ERF020-like [Magnolia sinica]|uniref:ethylene-responsive transcription factor ERF020-like n=1 Tax=Magnolia sinica TaxID=86752 RepID=UPI002657C413|nr:ethylene-responsive transcription factor ERF020-like [Magnolia sinica]
MRPTEEGRSNGGGATKYVGVRRRKWGRWVSEIRLPGSQTRLWLGSYSTPEAAAVAHDTAMFYLRGPSSTRKFNFPMCVPRFLQANMSPQLIQRAASDAGMAIDAKLAAPSPIDDAELSMNSVFRGLENLIWDDEDDDAVIHVGSEFREGEDLNISIDDMEICL